MMKEVNSTPVTGSIGGRGCGLRRGGFLCGGGFLGDCGCLGAGRRLRRLLARGLAGSGRRRGCGGSGGRSGRRCGSGRSRGCGGHGGRFCGPRHQDGVDGCLDFSGELALAIQREEVGSFLGGEQQQYPVANLGHTQLEGGDRGFVDEAQGETHLQELAAFLARQVDRERVERREYGGLGRLPLWPSPDRLRDACTTTRRRHRRPALRRRSPRTATTCPSSSWAALRCRRCRGAAQAARPGAWLALSLLHSRP